MDRGFIKLYRDMIDSGLGTLSFNHKSTLLYQYIALNAVYSGCNKGKLQCSINHLAYKVGESYHTTKRWLDELCKQGWLDMQKECKDVWILTVRNYCRISGNAKDAVNEVDMEYKNDEHLRLDNAMISDSYKPLKKEERKKEERRKEEEEEGVRKRTTASKKISRQQLQAMLKDEIMPFARSIGLDSTVVYEELDKWDDWVESKGKRFTDNRRAFKNWLRNAVKFRKDNKSNTISLDDLPRLS